MFNKIKVSYALFSLLLLVFLLPTVSSAQLESTNYQVDVFGVGNTSVGTGTSTNFTAEANIGPDFEYDTVTDTDGDGIPDATETANGTNPNDADDPVANGGGDTDGDSITNAVEFLIGGDTTSTTATQDTDGDGIADAREVVNGTDHTDADDPVAGGAGDTDSDGLPNGAESALCSAYPGLTDCTDPSPTSDSDGDGVTDIDEYNAGSDPTDEDDPTPQSTGGGGSSSSNNNDTADEAENAIEEITPEEAEGDGPEAISDLAAKDPYISGEGVNEASLNDAEILQTENSESGVDSSTDEQYILEERRLAITGQDEYISVTETFDDGVSITMGVYADAVLDSDGNPVTDDIELEIILRIRLLAPEQTPTDGALVVLEDAKVFELKVVDQFGTEYHQFDPALDVKIDLPGEIRQATDPKLYFFDETDQVWALMPEALFTNTSVSFRTSHLTVFGIWGGDDAGEQTIETLASEQSDNNAEDDQCQNIFVCYWWVFVIVAGLLVWWYSRRQNR